MLGTTTLFSSFSKKASTFSLIIEGRPNGLTFILSRCKSLFAELIVELIVFNFSFRTAFYFTPGRDTFQKYIACNIFTCAS